MLLAIHLPSVERANKHHVVENDPGQANASLGRQLLTGLLATHLNSALTGLAGSASFLASSVTTVINARAYIYIKYLTARHSLDQKHAFDKLMSYLDLEVGRKGGSFPHK